MTANSFLFSAALVASLITVDPAQSQELHLQGPEVVRHPTPDNFEVTARFIRQGEPTKDGFCRFESHLHVPPGGVIEEIEIEYDRLNCRSLVIQGRTKAGGSDQPTPGNWRPSNRSGSSSLDTTNALPSFPLVFEGANPTYWAYFRTWFQDPVFLPLNAVQSKVWWRPIDGCASGDYVNFEPAYLWLDLTGWYMVSSSDERSSNCSLVHLNSMATYQSDSFPTCRFGDSPQAIYDENTVEGLPDGSADGHSTVTKSGQKILCTNLWTERKKLANGVADTVLLDGSLGCSGADATLFFGLEVPIGGAGSFSSTSAGNDYDGTPLYFSVDGGVSDSYLTANIHIFYDSGMTQHVRTDKCEGPIGGTWSFYDPACALIADTSAGCVPIWMSLEEAEAQLQEKSGRTIHKPAAPVSLHR